MALESGQYIKDLVETNPPGTDAISQGDDHIRLIKKVLKQSFPSSVNGPMIPDISGNGEKYLQVKADESGTEWVDISIAASVPLNRSFFSRVNGSTLRIGGGSYYLVGTNTGMYSINSEIDFVLGPGGSNASSSAPATGWQYIYMDDSNISVTPIVSATAFINKPTAPTYDYVKSGWYDGNDRCIFAVYTNSGSMENFYHTGSDLVQYDGDQLVDSLTALTWRQITLKAPTFGTTGRHLTGFWGNGLTNLNGFDYFYRVTSSSSSFRLGRTEDDESEHMTVELITPTNNNQIEVNITQWLNNGGSGLPTLYTFSRGWFFPGGM